MQNYKHLFLDALGLRFLIPQSAEYEKNFMDKLTEFSGGELFLIPKGMTGYPLSARIEGDFGVIIFKYGSVSRNMTIHVEGKGHATQIIENFVRMNPNIFWVCTRVDVACDFKVPDCKIDLRKYKKARFKPKSKADGYWNVFEELEDLAKEKKMTTNPYGAGWLNGEKGRTFYIGSPASTGMYRLYEKSEEQWEKGFKAFPPNVIRFEWQYEPKGVQRDAITELDAHKIVANNRNAIKFFETVADCNIEFCSVGTVEKSGDDAVFANMIHQYKNVIDRLLKEHGFKWIIRTAFYHMRKGEAQT